MGFLEKAKQKIKNIPKSLGEETVRVIDQEEEDKTLDQPSEKAPVAPKYKSKSPSRSLAGVKSSIPKLINTPKPSTELKSNSVFSIENEEKTGLKNESLESSPEAQLKDILEVIGIPITFDIEQNIFLPDDMNNIKFDYQAPMGYDVGQVRAFVSKSRSSIEHFVRLLKLRNEHVAKLATTIDRLQVDLNNQKFQNEIANGINIMPTQDDDDLANQNMEYRLLNKRLEEEIASLRMGDGLSSEERQAFEDLQDQLSISRRENETLSEQVYELKNQLAYLEEEQDEDSDPSSIPSESNFLTDNTEDSGSFDWDNETVSTIDELPELGEMPIPTENESYNKNFVSEILNSTSFDLPDDSLNDFMAENEESYEGQENDGESMIDFMDQDKPQTNIRNNNEDDDDDPLDAIMREEWGNK
jgi:hypothetical protein